MEVSLLAFMLLAALAAAPHETQACACVPKDVACDEVAAVALAKPGSDVPSTTVTVAEQLETIKARCRKGRLVDPAGRQIRFYRMAGCWGNPPEDYQEILRRQER